MGKKDHSELPIFRNLSKNAGREPIDKRIFSRSGLMTFTSIVGGEIGFSYFVSTIF